MRSESNKKINTGKFWPCMCLTEVQQRSYFPQLFFNNVGKNNTPHLTNARIFMWAVIFSLYFSREAVGRKVPDDVLCDFVILLGYRKTPMPAYFSWNSDFNKWL